MSKFHLPFWKDAPFIRIIIPFITGITVSYHFGLYAPVYFIITGVCIAALAGYSLLKLDLKYRFRYLNGIVINVLIAAAGAWIAGIKNPFDKGNVIPITNNLEKIISGELTYTISLSERPLEKISSWKVLCYIESIQKDNEVIYPETNLLLYFKKDKNLVLPQYGNRIAFRKSPEKTKNFIAGSLFDYQRYCALKNIHYQVFLKPSEFVLLRSERTNPVTEFLFYTQEWVISVLQKNIKGDKEFGLAEALLIGYKNDLDKNLIQAYSNTGVVHVVAISGLHLGLIYTMLNIICRPFRRKALRPLIILTGLWMFSLLAGGAPSVLRSAVMFSSLVIGETVSRKSSVLNNLA